MASPVERPGRTADADGMRIVRHARWGSDLRLVLASVLALGVVVAIWRWDDGSTPTAPIERGPREALPVPRGEPSAAAHAEPASSIPATMPRTRGAKLRALRAMGVTPTKGPDGKRELAAAPVIEALQRAGVREGIAAFPPPGTDPPKSGIIVPDDWVLPEGYLRHHQTTDDGEQLPPILLFHPDYEFEDEHGNKIAVPPDRVVPPELAPPGLTVRLLDVPTRPR